MAKKIKFKLPDNLEEETKEYINNVLKYLEKNESLEIIDGGALYMLTESYNTYIKASRQLNEEGLTFENNMGNKTVHPAFQIRKAALAQAMDILRDYGLSIKSRKQIKKDETNETDSPLMDFLKNN